MQAVDLARELLESLPRATAETFTVIFGDVAAAEAALRPGGISNPVLLVNPNVAKPLAGPLLIVGAQNLQVCPPRSAPASFPYNTGFASYFGGLIEGPSSLAVT